MSLSDDLERALGGEPRAEEQRRKEEASPEAQAASILERMWNRENATAENALTHREALVLLLYGEEAGYELVEEEIEYGRYEPDGDVQVLLDKWRSRRAAGTSMN